MAKKKKVNPVEKQFLDHNTDDLSYFSDFIKSFDPNALRYSLNLSFLFNLQMVTLCPILKEHPNPKEFIEKIIAAWKRDAQKCFEPHIKLHTEKMQTIVGSHLAEKVCDSETMRITMNSVIAEIIDRYKAPLMAMIEEIENNRNSGLL